MKTGPVVFILELNAEIGNILCHHMKDFGLGSESQLLADV